jgi:hypothetical protein
MNRTLKETLTKLTRETGGDWVAPLPFALYRVWNSPYQLGLTPYEIMFGRRPLILPNLKAELIAEYDNRQLLDSLEAIAQAHKDIWPRLKAIYEAAPPPNPHNYQLGDWVYVCRHCQKNLEPRWKGPYVMLLTMPTGSSPGFITPTSGSQIPTIDWRIILHNGRSTKIRTIPSN